MKKFVSLALAALLAVGTTALVSCGGDDKQATNFTGEPDNSLGEVVTPVTPEAQDLSSVKIGMICLHDTASTYDKNFIDGLERARVNLGLDASQVIVKTNIAESSACKVEAENLVGAGCNLVFADSFGHEAFLMEAAENNPNVQFCHATGTQAHTANLDNYHNAFASIYEGRYLAGVCAGLKLKEMNNTNPSVGYHMGYVGAFPYAEVISGFTSFYLGAKSVAPEVTMTVRYTDSWYDLTAEGATATTLIEDDHCVLISQHADSMGAPTACEQKGVPNVSYNGSTQSAGPNTYIISSKIDWTPYFEYIIKCVASGTAIAKDWTGTLKNGSVALEALNTSVAAQGTQAKLDEVKADLIAGRTHVFDVAKDNFITVNGKKITAYLADVDDDGTYAHETQVIGNGYFHESLLRSAPYFDIIIDGITSNN